MDEVVAVIAEEGEVIDVSDVVGGIDSFRDEVIELVQVQIGKELAGEVADRESFGTQGAEEVVTGEVDQGRGGIDVDRGDAGVDDGVY